MKLRYYRTEGTIRSIGDPPNGILAFDSRDGRATWVIDAGLQPDGRRLGGPIGEREQRGVLLEGRPPNLAVVDAASVVDACGDDHDTRASVIQAIVVAVASAAQLLRMSPHHITDLEAVVALARETVDAAVERGWA